MYTVHGLENERLGTNELFFLIFQIHILDEIALTDQKRLILLKVYIFNAILAAAPETESAATIRGYFICAGNERCFKNQLRNALKAWGLSLREIEREREISEELLGENLPHVHMVYRARGYGLELYRIMSGPDEGQRSITPLGMSRRGQFERQSFHE